MKQSVNFPNKALTLAGELYLPDDFDENRKYSAIIGIHPGGGVKEQTIGIYAQKLAARGFAVLTFDASYQGDSEGEPRSLEDPFARVEDVRCAADYLSTLPYIKENEYGVLGICAGGGYAINSALTEKRIKAVGTVSAVDVGAFFRGDGIPGKEKENLETLKSVASLRSAAAKGGEIAYMTWLPSTAEEAANSPMVLQKEGYEYYCTPRGQHKNSQNRLPMCSLDKLFSFSAFAQIPSLLDQPLLAIAGSEADTFAFSENAVKLSNAPAELAVIEGATHVAMYDIPEYVDQAIEKLNAFFEKHL